MLLKNLTTKLRVLFLHSPKGNKTRPCHKYFQKKFLKRKLACQNTSVCNGIVPLANFHHPNKTLRYHDSVENKRISPTMTPCNKTNCVGRSFLMAKYERNDLVNLHLYKAQFMFRITSHVIKISKPHVAVRKILTNIQFSGPSSRIRHTKLVQA